MPKNIPSKGSNITPDNRIQTQSAVASDNATEEFQMPFESQQLSQLLLNKPSRKSLKSAITFAKKTINPTQVQRFKNQGTVKGYRSASNELGYIIGLSSAIAGLLAMVIHGFLLPLLAIGLGLVAIYSGLGWKGKILGYIGTILGVVGLFSGILGGALTLLIQLLLLVVLVLVIWYLIKKVL